MDMIEKSLKSLKKKFDHSSRVNLAIPRHVEHVLSLSSSASFDDDGGVMSVLTLFVNAKTTKVPVDFSLTMRFLVTHFLGSCER